MRFPVDNPYRITTYFSAAHPGIDIAPIPAGQRGRPCYAPERSRVVASAYKPALEGHYVMLQGLVSGKYFYFGHFLERLVRLGETIEEGRGIGILGMTGLATGIHTHFEVRNTVNGNQINPLEYFKSAPAQGGMVMVDGNMLNNLYKAVFGRAPDPGAKGYIGMPGDVVLQQMLDAKEEAAFEKAARLEVDNAKLKEQLENSDGTKFEKIEAYIKKG